jgi:hypothetical protein
VFRPEFTTVGLVPEETYNEHALTNIGAGYPVITATAPHDVPLAIVGGGPSAAQALDELRAWPGHIWGINQGASWLAREAPGAMVWMFSVDPDPCLAEWTSGVERALLGSSCHPKVFEALKGKVQMFHTRIVPGVQELKADDGSGAPPITANLMGPSSVCRTFLPAAMLGYKDVTYFGCEGSLADRTHAYRHEHRERQMIILAGGVEYFTTPDYYITTRFLVSVMRRFPRLKEKSGGLLRAMLMHPESWDVVALSGPLRDQVDPSATTPYIPKVA